MVSFNVVITPTAKRLLNEYIDYIQFTLLNSEAADAVLTDALEVIDDLAFVAESLPFCRKPS